MEQLGASRMTVHRALVQLAREGAALPVGAARAPSSRARRRATPLFDILSSPEEVRRLGQHYAYRRSCRLKRWPAVRPRSRSRFGIKRSEKVAHLVVLHRADGKPPVLEERIIQHAPVYRGSRRRISPRRRRATGSLQHSALVAGRACASAPSVRVQRRPRCSRLTRESPACWSGAAPGTRAQPVTAVRLLHPGSRHRFVGAFRPLRRGLKRKGPPMAGLHCLLIQLQQA